MPSFYKDTRNNAIITIEQIVNKNTYLVCTTKGVRYLVDPKFLVRVKLTPKNSEKDVA